MSYLATLRFFAAFEAAVGRETLEFSLIISFGQDGFNSSGTVPAIDLALEHINQTDQVLPGYKLQHGRVQDSEVRFSDMPDVFALTCIVHICRTSWAMIIIVLLCASMYRRMFCCACKYIVTLYKYLHQTQVCIRSYTTCMLLSFPVQSWQLPRCLL